MRVAVPNRRSATIPLVPVGRGGVDDSPECGLHAAQVDTEGSSDDLGQVHLDAGKAHTAQYVPGGGLGRVGFLAGPTSSPTLDLVKQVLLMVGAALLYFAVRGLSEGRVGVAIRHGHDILRLESRLGLDWERGLQSLIIDHHVLVTLANWIYIYGHWPVIAATLVWLFHCHRRNYLLLRNAMFVSGAIGLVIFATYPVAPPRLLDIGLQDTVTTFSTSYRALQPPALINKYAALPSLHLGWNLLVGITVFRTDRRTALRLFAVIGPILMAWAVVATANHYVLDAVVGAVVALIGLAVARHGR
ncbi:MAG TPA: phosphatase PAP2 family protein [Acidimicrobiales bacterium]|nr:phosphatase PAP2 family protein [Acidimicrobiales bacterium]